MRAGTTACWARARRGAVGGTALLAVGMLVAMSGRAAERPQAADETPFPQPSAVGGVSPTPPSGVPVDVAYEGPVEPRAEQVATGPGSDPIRTMEPGLVDAGPDHAASAAATARRPLVFASNPGGDWEIYTMDTQRGVLRRLTSHPGVDRQPTWSPDGTRIAFVRDVGEDNPELHVMEADGSAAVRITEAIGEDLSPAWSPDGSWLAFTSDNEGAKRGAVSYTGEQRPVWSQELFVVRADGSERRRLFGSERWDLDVPTWSPDGTRIAVTAWDPDTLRSAILAIDVATGRDRELLDEDAFLRDAAWSPDGEAIAFRLDRRGTSQLHLLDVANGAVRQLSTDAAYAALPAWSADGRHIVFTRDVDGPRYGMEDDAGFVECAAIRSPDPRGTVDLCPAGPVPSEIWSVAVDGTRLTRVFAHRADAADAEP